MEKWMIRVTNVSKELIVGMLERFSNDALVIVCAEGEPFDKGIQPHVHIYTENKHSESWLRKQIQNLDNTRKSNQLYSMKKAHENSVNYVLKSYFNEDENRSRIWFQRNCSLDLILTWKKSHLEYMAEVNRSKVVRKNSKKSFSRLIIEEVTGKYQGSSPIVSELIHTILQIYKREKVNLPTRNQMESYVLNIRYLLGEEQLVEDFYYKIFSQH